MWDRGYRAVQTHALLRALFSSFLVVRVQDWAEQKEHLRKLKR
jgi:hypothetical protein